MRLCNSVLMLCFTYPARNFADQIGARLLNPLHKASAKCFSENHKKKNTLNIFPKYTKLRVRITFSANNFPACDSAP